MKASLIERLFRLDGRTAIVTGASRGIGAALARGLAEAGATVTGLGRSAAPDWQPQRGLRYLPCDVADQAAFGTIVDMVATEHGRVDVLVNAAGVAHRVSGADQPLQHFDRLVEVNLRAIYACCLKAAEYMRAEGHGSVINLTSIASVLGMPDNAAYVAAKGGLRMLTKALALDYGPYGVRVNNLAPGYIRTAMTEASYGDPALNLQRRKHTMLNRWGEPEDLVGAAIFLASDASAYVTGQDLFVDGGWTAKGLTD